LNPLIIIPARGGSKRIHKKNIKLFNGKPLIYYTIEVARELFNDEIICVSTDDKEIKSIVESYGLKTPFLRPSYLASDSATTRDVIIDTVKWYEQNGYHPDTIILLQPTSPLRTINHLKNSLLEWDNSLDMITSVSLPFNDNLKNIVYENENDYLIKIKETNILNYDQNKIYQLNGAIYIIKVDSLKTNEISEFSKVKKFMMKKINSVDIDTIQEWNAAESIYLNKLD
tara:strand:+ start:1715 stop:2398 length:684 start_codon:yes stop_codon:yes gene_type:complete